MEKRKGDGMVIRLVERSEKPGGKREILINKEEFLIGRGNDCDLRLTEAEISRHHCILRTRGLGTILQDLGSSNGTYLNGHRVISQAALNPGDLLKLGRFEFLLEFDDRDAISWGDEDASSSQATCKIKDIRKSLQEEVRKESEQSSSGSET